MMNSSKDEIHRSVFGLWSVASKYQPKSFTLLSVQERFLFTSFQNISRVSLALWFW